MLLPATLVMLTQLTCNTCTKQYLHHRPCSAQSAAQETTLPGSHIARACYSAGAFSNCQPQAPQSTGLTTCTAHQAARQEARISKWARQPSERHSRQPDQGSCKSQDAPNARQLAQRVHAVRIQHMHDERADRACARGRVRRLVDDKVAAAAYPQLLVEARGQHRQRAPPVRELHLQAPQAKCSHT